jgi:hypothetical protein
VDFAWEQDEGEKDGGEQDEQDGNDENDDRQSNLSTEEKLLEYYNELANDADWND